MRLFVSMSLLLFCLPAIGIGSDPIEKGTGRVEFDFEMVEIGIDWLDLINSGANDDAVRAFYMEHIVPTRGCRAIIQHWARFRRWDAEELFSFIMTGLGRIPSEEKTEEEDGSLTFFGMRRQLWREAADNTERMRRDLLSLKQADMQQGIRIARSFLPGEAVLDAGFSFVLFGASTAFSVGRENGFDFLQLPRTSEGSLDIDRIVGIIAHELHHAGFAALHKKTMAEVSDQDRLMLLGILAAEGMPTYFIDEMQIRIHEYRNSRNEVMNRVAADWDNHSRRLDELFRQAEKDLWANLEGRMSQQDIMTEWMAGYKGPAYVLGAKIIEVVDTYLGREAAISIAGDYRKLIRLYNRAAGIAESRGKEVFRFSHSLEERLSGFKGANL